VITIVKSVTNCIGCLPCMTSLSDWGPLCMSSLLTGDATSDASSRLALQGGAVAAWSRGCLVVATWLRVECVLVGQTCDCAVFGNLSGLNLLMCCKICVTCVLIFLQELS